MKLDNAFITKKVVLGMNATILMSKIELGGCKLSFNPTNVNAVDAHYGHCERSGIKLFGKKS